MKSSFITAILLFFCLSGMAQTYKINYALNARVDTSDEEIKAVLNTWIGYLESRPDSVYDNPFWNSAEKKKYTDFDFTAKPIYAFPAPRLLQYFRLTVLSVTKEDSAYAIRTLFYREGLSGIDAASNPYCITRVYAVKESGSWKLMNALPFVTKNWMHKKVGKINYVFAPDFHFDQKKAEQANRFCDSIAKVFDTEWQPFTCYITRSRDELGELEGFDFFFAGGATGLTFYNERMVFSGFGSELYAHEFVHLVAGIPVNQFVSEGLATWLGGSVNKTFHENVISLSTQVAKNDTITIWNVYNKEWGWPYNAFYTTGAILCDMIYKKKGMEGIRKYYNAPKETDAFINTLCELLDMKSEDIDKNWRAYLLSVK